jgi:hypothetical protein
MPSLAEILVADLLEIAKQYEDGANRIGLTGSGVGGLYIAAGIYRALSVWDVGDADYMAEYNRLVVLANAAADKGR